MKPYSMMTEAELQVAVADYLRLQYPDVMFHSDFGSGVKLSAQQARRQKRQNGGRRAWPDMFVAKTRIFHEEYEGYGMAKVEKGHVEFGGSNIDGEIWISCGLFLELKKEGTRLKRKRKIPNEGIMDCGSVEEWATEHIAEQAKVLESLRQRGYCAEFAVGFEEAKKIIDEYLGSRA